MLIFLIQKLTEYSKNIFFIYKRVYYLMSMKEVIKGGSRGFTQVNGNHKDYSLKKWSVIFLLPIPLSLTNVPNFCRVSTLNLGVSSSGMPWHCQILADQLNLSQRGGTDYAHQIIMATPRIFRPSYGPEIQILFGHEKKSRVVICLQQRNARIVRNYVGHSTGTLDKKRYA